MASELSLDIFLFGQRCRGIYSKIPTDIPEQLAKLVVPSHHVGAIFSITGDQHVCYRYSTDWFDKKQTTLETATCSSEFVV